MKLDSESEFEALRGARPPEPSETESEEGLFRRDFDAGEGARKRLLRAVERDAARWFPDPYEAQLAG